MAGSWALNSVAIIPCEGVLLLWLWAWQWWGYALYPQCDRSKSLKSESKSQKALQRFHKLFSYTSTMHFMSLLTLKTHMSNITIVIQLICESFVIIMHISYHVFEQVSQLWIFQCNVGFEMIGSGIIFIKRTMPHLNGTKRYASMEDNVLAYCSTENFVCKKNNNNCNGNLN